MTMGMDELERELGLEYLCNWTLTSTKAPLAGFVGDQRGAAWVQLVISLTMAIIGMPLLMSIEESVENPKFLAIRYVY